MKSSDGLIMASALCCLLAAPGALADSVQVIPTGREAFILDMLGPKGVTLAGKCRLDSARIEKSFIRADYRCTGSGKAGVELHPGAFDGKAVARTDQFLLVAATTPVNTALVEALANRIRGKEKDWAWESVVPNYDKMDPDAKVEVPATPPANSTLPYQVLEMTEERRNKFIEAGEHNAEGRFEEAYPLLYDLALAEPLVMTLGQLVVAIAGPMITRDRVEELVAAADRNPDVPLDQFVAGVSAHYRGHKSGRTRDEKTRAYQSAIRYLNRALPAFEHSPRVWIYLAVSHYRTGDQANAEENIARAVKLAEQTGDADAFYCRAEIFHRQDVKRSVEDLKRYVTMMGDNIALGAIHSETKDVRVREMLTRLEQMARDGETVEDEELFDPVADLTHEVLFERQEILWAAAVALGLAVVLVLFFRRRR